MLLGTPDGGLGHPQAADTTTYRDAQSGTEVPVHHARLANLRPGTYYIYAAMRDGAPAELGTIRTVPRGRVPFTFTSFGDQATPTLGKLVDTSYVNDNLGSPFAGDLTAAVERVDPLSEPPVGSTTQFAVPTARCLTGTSCPAAANALVSGLRTMLQVSYCPLPDAVARLDTSTPTWMLYLDSDSPAEDHCWAILDVIRILIHGVDAAESATRVPQLRLVRD